MWILLLEALVALTLLFAIVWASKPRKQPPAAPASKPDVTPTANTPGSNDEPR
ncbi:hypothetical protein [Uliginosibacterium sp. H1]|uniref:hypothetical protein n=1 Tax=Uliginosibacterium sp. H1 TaxID=3114757 RepID=UPI002E19C59B|nr:hypothetical protein [Uliginosibacterium sp. H1]